MGLPSVRPHSRIDDTPRGTLRVSTTFTSRARDLFADFARDYPQVRLVTSTNRHVDLVAEGIDVAIRGGEISDPNLIARRLFNDRSVAVASPAYLERNGVAQSPEELAHHELIVGFGGTSAPSRTWPLVRGDQIQIPHHLASTDMKLRIDWALADLGIAMAPTSFLESHVEAGRLVYVLDGEVGAAATLSIVYVDREYQAPQVRAFIERAVEFFLGPKQ